MINIKHKGDFTKTKNFLNKIKDAANPDYLSKYGEAGVNALMQNTPVKSGLTASSWYYEVTKTKTTTTISFLNSNIQNGVPIAIILQYGHGTRNGGYVQGKDYINPAIQPIFDQIANKAWNEVTNV